MLKHGKINGTEEIGLVTNTPGDNPKSEPVMALFADVYMRQSASMN